MIPLPLNFREDGFDFSIVKRNRNFAILKKSKSGKNIFYEVVQIQHRPEETIHWKVYPAREVMPRPEQWGTAGWSCHDRKRAELKFEELTRKGRFSHEGIA